MIRLDDALRDRIRRGIDLAALISASMGVVIQVLGLPPDPTPRTFIPAGFILALAICGLLGRLGRAAWTPLAYIALIVACNVVYMTSFGPWMGLGVVYVLTVAISFIFVPRHWRATIAALLVGTPLVLALLVATGAIPHGPVLDLANVTARRRATVASLTGMIGIALVVTYIVRQLVNARRDIESATALEREQRAEQTRIEAELARARRADLIAQLAAQVGADIGAALAIIEARAAALGPQLAGATALECLTDITDATAAAADTMRSLTAFAPDARPPGLVRGNATEAARAIRKLMRRTLPARIELAIHATDDVWVPMATSDLARICSNLVLNARDAIAAAGSIELRIASDVEHATIVVEDTGSGMPPDVLAQLFQPFFTTKAVGRGTGLGLATTRILVERAGGAIDVTSTVGRGTRFTIRLPRLAAVVPLAAPAASADRAAV